MIIARHASMRTRRCALASQTLLTQALALGRLKNRAILAVLSVLAVLAVLPASATDGGGLPTPARDFDGDGKADLYWRHDDGQTYYWRMDGLTLLSGGGAVSVDPAWRSVGLEDEIRDSIFLQSFGANLASRPTELPLTLET